MKKNSCNESEKYDLDENGNKENLDVHKAELETVSEKSVKRKKGINWSEKETNYFIQLCIEKQILKLMDGKKYKHVDVYKSLESDMKQAGFIKNGIQMRQKMKYLKKMYYKCKRNNSISGHDRMSFQYFEAMDELLGSRPSAKAVDGVGSESNASESQELEIIQGTDENVEFIAKDVLVDSPPIVSNKKRQKTEGRLSNVKRAEQFSETFVKKQSEMFHEIINKQNELFEKFVQEQMEEQRKWGDEMIKKEHDYQMQQMNVLMDGFLKGLQTIQQPQYLSSFHPTTQFSGPSAYFSQTPSHTFMPSPSPFIWSSNSSSSMSLQPSKSFVSASPSPSTCPLDCIASSSSSSLEIPLSPLPHHHQSPLGPSPNHQLSSSVPPNMYFIPIKSPPQTPSATNTPSATVILSATDTPSATDTKTE